MKPTLRVFGIACLLWLAPPAAADDENEDTIVPPPGDDDGGSLPCVVIDWNHLTVGTLDNCWGP